MPRKTSCLCFLLIMSGCGGNNSPTSSSPEPTPTPTPQNGTCTIHLAGAGDITSADVNGNVSSGTIQTGEQMRRLNPDYAVLFGDVNNLTGTYGEFMLYFEPYWGFLKGKFRPSPGNHDYDNKLEGYFGYFAEIEKRRYYAFKACGWQIISLDSVMLDQNIDDEIGWLKNTLVSEPSKCTIAYWHYPLFSSGKQSGDKTAKLFWEELYSAGTEVVFNGHEHFYERFAPQTPAGKYDPEKGIRQFVVGTGGAYLYDKAKETANSEVWLKSHGVIDLEIKADQYSWKFILQDKVLDSGTERCH